MALLGANRARSSEGRSTDSSRLKINIDIAYRAETALVQLARETLRRHDDARSFVRALFATSVNLRPDPARNELRVEIHGQANPIHDATLESLCTELNATEICYPGTTLRLVYRPIRSSVFPPGQDV